MKANITDCLALIGEHEGGYVNHKKDPGGATMKGITQRVYDGFRSLKGLKQQPVKQISDAEVETIYRKQYWDAVRGDELPPGIDLAVFDYAVNSGVARAAKELQRVLRLNQVDGHIGVVTLAKAREADAAKIITAICEGRFAFLQRAKNPKTGARLWPTFRKGWTMRVNKTCAAALKMAKQGA